ncbi:hypothetical protein DPMN_050852 [Dreissena polymorpha]|uniref:Uncharacterized protein n=1 Tax=Dreissena polymorpha TaxID=45954 RepID=A0A9D4HPP6_DREPO|nr:hypothetical protein DPMN_050852 [Dreissena polymorpha]
MHPIVNPTRLPMASQSFFAKLRSLKNDVSTLYFRKRSESTGSMLKYQKRCCQCVLPATVPSTPVQMRSRRFASSNSSTNCLRETHAGVQPEHERGSFNTSESLLVSVGQYKSST